ncbi:MAG: IPT/TIG domain-containing protein [Polyangiaceae bacterium]
MRYLSVLGVSAICVGCSDAESPDPEPPPVAPSLTSIAPALGDPAGGVTIHLTGEHLGSVTAVDLGGSSCEGLVVRSEDSIDCIAPALAVGRYDIVASSPAGDARLDGAWESWSPASLPGARLFQSDSGVERDGDIADTPVWSMLTSEAPFRPRDGAGLVYALGRLWLLGGWDPAAPKEWSNLVTTNEVWVSDDGGVTWTEVLAHDSAPPTSGPTARFGPRHTAGWLRHEVDGVEYLYVVGGDIFDAGSPDVWRSANGVDWELVTNAAPWGPRVLQMVGVYAGDLYVMGGQLDISDPATCLSDVWRSSDGGFTWEELPDAPWAPRGMVYSLVEHAGYLWLVGGGTYDDAPRTYYNDVWRFDGQTWEEVLSNGDAPWAPREYHNVFAWRGELWLSSGYEADDQNHGDVWHSVDGVNWLELPARGFAPGHADGLAVTPDGPVHASGNAFDREVFRMQIESAAPVSSWAPISGGAPLLVAPGPRPMSLSSSMNGLPAIRLSGGAVLRRDWDALPAGLSVFWIGRSLRKVESVDSPNPGQTILGDSLGSCRAELGYGGDQAELVLVDAAGSWADGHMVRGPEVTDGEVHLVGFTIEPTGQARAYVDGHSAGEVFMGPYDAPYVGWDSLGAGFGLANADVDLGAVLVVSSALDSTAIERLAAWSRRWGAALQP